MNYRWSEDVLDCREWVKITVYSCIENIYANFLMRVVASCQGHEVLLPGSSVLTEANAKWSMVPATSWGRVW